MDAVIHQKLWGTSVTLGHDCDYQLDRIVVYQGGYCSLHRHQWKHNLFIVLAGELRVDWSTENDHREVIITPDAPPCQIPAGTLHRFTGLAETTHALELYTPIADSAVELDDIVRLEPGGVLRELAGVKLFIGCTDRS